MAELGRVISILAGCVLLMATFCSGASAEDSSDSKPRIGGGFVDSGVRMGADNWMPDPDTGEITRASAGTINTDPNEYKYELQCHLGGGDFDTPCLAHQLDCRDREDGAKGIPVIWLSRPRGVPGAVWAHHSGPTCLYDPKPEDLLPRIAADIQRQFQNLPVNAGKVVAQPSPNTLRGAETNFYAEAAEQ